MRSWRSAARKVSVRQWPCGDLGDQPLAPRRPAVGARHVGLGPGLVDEDQAGRIKPSLILFPLRPPPGDVRTILLAGVQAFF